MQLSTRSLEPSFGLLFGDLLRTLNVATTGAAVIVSTQDALINFSGLFAGPLIRRFSYRAVTVAGAALVAAGILGTTTASNIPHIIATYSVILGLGVGLSSAGTFVALSNYWAARRGQAVGLSMAGTALGFMLFPLLVRLLLDELGFRGALVVLGGIALHGLAGAALLQPVEWHLVPADPPKKEVEMVVPEDNRDSHAPLLARPRIDVTLVEEDEALSTEETPVTPDSQPPRKMSLPVRQGIPRNTSVVSMSHADEQVCANGRRVSRTNIPRNMSWVSMVAEENAEMSRPQGRVSVHVSARIRKTSVISASSLDLTGSLLGIAAASQQDIRSVGGMTASIPSVHEPKKPTCWHRVSSFLDLDLLRDPHYVLVTFGLSMFWVAELHFKMVVPFFLRDLGVDKANVAFCLSMTAVSDIVARLVLPPLCDRVKYTKRSLFFVACVFLGITRSALAEQTEWVPMLTVLVICGFCRGATLINYQLTVAECVSLDRLPGAVGLNMVAKGIAVVALGPLLGFIRDATGSYSLFIHAQSGLMAIGLLTWMVEWTVVWIRSRHSKDTLEPVDTNDAELSV